MPNTRVRIGRVRKVLGWLPRHKVTTGFGVIVVALALYLGGSWVVLQVQIHSERQRFIGADIKLSSMYGKFYDGYRRPDSQLYEKNCSYTHVEIGKGSRTCDINYYFIYSANDLEAAKNISYKLNLILSSQTNLQLNAIAMNNEANIGAYDFVENKIQCSIGYWFYDESKLPFEVSGLNLTSPSGLFANMNCGGGAKAEYFPVISS